MSQKQANEAQQRQDHEDGINSATNNNSVLVVDKDPLLQLPSSFVRDGDYVILAFADGRQVLAQALSTKSWRGKHAPFKFQKKSYSTNQLIGLPYGTVLEINPSTGLVPLPEGEDVVPRFHNPTTNIVPGSSAPGDSGPMMNGPTSTTEDGNEGNAEDNTFPAVSDDKSSTAMMDAEPSQSSSAAAAAAVTALHHPDHHHLHDNGLNQQVNDNRHIIDNNDSQGLDSTQIKQMIEDGAHGSDIVSKLVQNSSSFGQKTMFSQAKYIVRKQRKYQPRCRIVRCTPLSMCESFFKNKSRQILNMRDDTLGQILSYSNVSAGCQVLVYEHCMGILTGAMAQRMGGYGQILSLYETQQPSFTEMIQKFNLTFAEHQSIKWIHTGDVFGRRESNGGTAAETTCTDNNDSDSDPEKTERDGLTWPIVLQDHTRTFIEKMKSDKERKDFLKKRCARFARKLTRNTPTECNEFLFGSSSSTSSTSPTTIGTSDNATTKKTARARKCDSIVLAIGQYDSSTVLLELWDFLAPSSPFVVYCEYIEPLTECFDELQQRKLAINLRLSDTWMREYQVLPGRTHPSMNMTQSGGFILTGIKLDPLYGQNEIDEDLAKEIRQQIGGRRGKKKKRNTEESDANDGNLHEGEETDKKKQRSN